MQMASMCESELLNSKRRKSNKCEGKQLFAPIFSLASRSDPSGGRHRHVAANLYTLLRGTGMHSLHFGWLLRLQNSSKMPKSCTNIHHKRCMWRCILTWHANLCAAVSFPRTNRCRTRREPFVTLMIEFAMCLYPVHASHFQRMVTNEHSPLLHVYLFPKCKQPDKGGAFKSSRSL